MPANTRTTAKASAAHNAGAVARSDVIGPLGFGLISTMRAGRLDSRSWWQCEPFGVERAAAAIRSSCGSTRQRVVA